MNPGPQMRHIGYRKHTHADSFTPPAALRQDQELLQTYYHKMPGLPEGHGMVKSLVTEHTLKMFPLANS